MVGGDGVYCHVSLSCLYGDTGCVSCWWWLVGVMGCSVMGQSCCIVVVLMVGVRVMVSVVTGQCHVCRVECHATGGGHQQRLGVTMSG